MGSGASRENNDAAYMKYVQQRQCSDAPGQTMSQEEESSSAMLKGTPAPTVVTGGVVTEVYNCAQTASTVETGLRASYSAKSAQSITVNGGASQLAKNRGDRPIVPKPQNITYQITPTTDGCEIPSRSNFVPSEQTVNTQSLGGKAPEMKGVRGTPPRPRQSHPKNTLIDKKLFLAPMQKGESDQFFKRMIEKYYSIATANRFDRRNRFKSILFCKVSPKHHSKWWSFSTRQKPRRSPDCAEATKYYIPDYSNDRWV